MWTLLKIIIASFEASFIKNLTAGEGFKAKTAGGIGLVSVLRLSLSLSLSLSLCIFPSCFLAFPFSCFPVSIFPRYDIDIHIFFFTSCKETTFD